MKRLVAVGLILALVGPASVALAGKAKPVKTTLYAHGPSPVGEIDGIQWVANTFPTTSPLTLDAEEPTGATPKSQSIATPVINSQCTGTPIGNPVFQGQLEGTITGDITLTAHFASLPGEITARVWTDVPIFQCNESYIPPNRKATITLPAGQGETEVKIPNGKLRAKSFITIQLLAEDVVNGYAGQIGRLLYDSTDTPTRLEFSCLPASGSSCLP